MHPDVAVSIPARNRAWIIPHLLESLEAQTYPREHLGFRFIAHNCNDGTYDLLKVWCAENEGRYRYCEVIPKDDSTKEDNRSGIRDGSAGDPRHAQADLKNILCNRLTEGEYWFFCDSDIALHPDCISRLVETGKDICGGITNVVPFNIPIGMWNYFPKNERKGMPFSRGGVISPPDTLTEVGAVFGILLYSPYALQRCTFKLEGTGEDEGAIRDAERAGISVWLEPTAKGLHVMEKEDLPQALEEWQKWSDKFSIR